MKLYHKWDDLPWEDVLEGLKRKVIPAEGGTLVLNHMTPGTVVPVHSHSHEQVMIIIEGEGEAIFDNERIPMRPGSFFVIKPNLNHGFVVTGTQEVLNLDVFIPKRTEYEQQYQSLLAELKNG